MQGDAQELMTPAQVAALLYVAPKTVSRWAAAGKLTSIRTPGGHRRYLRVEVLAIAAGHSVVPIPPSEVAAELDSQRQAAAAAVVAEAVALAMEAAATAAAEAVLLTAVAVTEAAGRAAAAAERARQARAFAAETAAASVALQAERTAAQVKERAALAAARVQRAATLAADELARCLEHVATPDARHLAEAVAATVQAAADATDAETTAAADAVLDAGSVAAAEVAQLLAAAEESVQRDVASLAEAQRGIAVAAADAVALETDARAVGAARAASAAAVALLVTTPARDLAGGTDVTGASAAVDREGLLQAAAARDARAVVRDLRAEEREAAVSRGSFIGDPQDDEPVRRAGGVPGRRAAAPDRLDARSDRASAASDRARLSAPSPSDLAAGLSHDLKVPLSSIIASVELLADELSVPADSSIAVLLDRATRAGERMLRMIDHDLPSQVLSGSPARPETDLGEVVGQFVRDNAVLLESVGAVVDADELPVVRADPDELYSVVQNLLVNSVKFARPGVPSRVRITARRAGTGWRVSVRDNGVGLQAASGLGLFSWGSRGSRTVGGHGIGLAMVARIVAAHGGRVGIAPVETGAEIWFELPGTEAAV